MVRGKQVATAGMDDAYESFVRILHDYLETHHRI